MSKKLSVVQLILLAVSILVLIIMFIGFGGGLMFYSSGAPILFIILYSASVLATFVIGILQIVFGAKARNGVALAAGIVGVLA